MDYRRAQTSSLPSKEKEPARSPNVESPLRVIETAGIEYSDGASAIAVFEDDRWKIDDTEKLKEQLLGMDLLNAEQKERIKKY